MALYRTERRLNWHHELRIGHWYAPWSQAQTDIGADYFSRTLRWLIHRYPKASVTADSHALPTTDAQWPKERFGLFFHAIPVGENIEEPIPPHNASDTQNEKQPAHAGDLLLIEWPQPTIVQAPLSDAGSKPSAGAEPKSNTKAELPPLWINGLERALRRNWQDNRLCEVILIGGTEAIDAKGLALAAHYGLTVLDPAALLSPTDGSTIDHRKALIDEGQAGTPTTLTPQGQEIWAGMMIGLLRERIRTGPTPDPVSLPEGLWCR